MTVNSFNSEPPPARTVEKDAPPAIPGTGEVESLLYALLAACRSLESATFRITLRDQQTGQATFCEEGHLLKLLGYLPDCLSRLWRWNEVLVIESCAESQERNLDVER